MEVVLFVGGTLCLLLLGALIGSGLRTKRQDQRSRAQAERERLLNEQSRQLASPGEYCLLWQLLEEHKQLDQQDDAQ